jgi:hypothetical protein
VRTELRSIALAAILTAVVLAGCGQQEAPPPPKVEPPKPVVPALNDELKRLVGEVYVYAYPLVLTDITRQVQAARAPLNVFQHKREVAGASSTDPTPNADFLHSQAWLDLSQEPLILSVPDTRGRYYLIAMIDAWTNVAASLGKRTVGTEKGDFAIVGPRWKGTLPVGVSEVRSPTEMAWLFGRMQAGRKADQAAAARLQEQIKLAPLSRKSARPAKGAPAPAAPAGKIDLKTDPREQVAGMDAATFLSRVAMLLPGNPPAKDDAPMVGKLKTLGVVAGQPFDMGKLDPLSARSVEEGVKSALAAIVTAGKRPASADIRNGWAIDRELGRWGTDYGKRAVVAWRGLGVNAPEDAIFMAARFDSGGQRLDGAQRYVLHFDRANIPPAEGFWSLSLYDDNQHFVANSLDRHHIGSDDELTPNADGSLDLYIQNADPGKDKEPNWLPAPKGSFTLILRIYWPKEEVVNGRWAPPGVRRAT